MALNQAKINKDIAEEVQSPLLEQLLKDCRALVDMSRKKMGEHYAKWDHAQATFEGYTNPDKDDKEARERKEPDKMVVPISYAQTMTFVAFCYALFTQRERMFELLGMSPEDHRAAKIGEALIARDLSKNIFEEKLSKFLLDIGRYGLGVTKTYWVRETQRVKKTITKPMISIFGMGIGQTTVEVEETVVKYLGNKIINISPYRFYPDTRLPLSRFQEGEFVASEDEYTIAQLKKMEQDGVVFGIDHIKPMKAKELEDRGPTRSAEDIVQAGRHTDPTGSGQSKGITLVTEVERTIIPKDYEVDGVPLSDDAYPCKYLIWYANDQRIIRFEKLGYDHDEFTYSIGTYTSDDSKLIGLSLSDTIDTLQAVISWFINSHIASVRKVISDRMVVDTSAINMDDLKDRRPVIRLKNTAAGGIDRYLKQLDIKDVTQSHMADQEILQRIVQVVTGISDSLLGQLHTGRRSATEAKNSFSGATNRLKMVASIIFRTGLESMARQMLSNLRQGLDVETMVRVVGLPDAVEGGPVFLKADKSALVGDFDFEIFDGTLPSEKAYNAEAIGDLLKTLISAPQAAIALSIDPKLLLREWLELRGIRNPERFALAAPPPQPGQDPNAAASGPQDPNQSGTPPGVSGTEGESILSVIGGGAEPQSGAGNY